MVLNQLLVDDAAGIGVSELTSLVFHKESLRDALVNHHDGQLRLVGGLVVHGVDGSLELGDLLGQNLQTLGITDTVAVNHVVGRELTSVEGRKGPDCLHQSLLHAVLDDLLALRLDKVLGEVLTHLLVDAAGQTDHGLWTRVAHVNADQHGSLLVEHLRELQVVEVAASLAVDLANDVGGFGEVELVRVAEGHDLRGDAVLKHYLLEHLVVVFSLEHAEHNSRMTELSSSLNVLADLSVEFATVVLFLHLDPVGLLNLDSELLRGLHEIVVNGVSCLEDAIVAFVNHDPAVFKQVGGLDDGLLAE